MIQNIKVGDWVELRSGGWIRGCNIGQVSNTSNGQIRVKIFELEIYGTSSIVRVLSEEEAMLRKLEMSAI